MIVCVWVWVAGGEMTQCVRPCKNTFLPTAEIHLHQQNVGVCSSAAV